MVPDFLSPLITHMEDGFPRRRDLWEEETGGKELQVRGMQRGCTHVNVN